MIKQDWPAIFPPGMHAKTLVQIEAACIYGNLGTDRRIELFARLNLFLQLLVETGISGEAWIDGSFSTTKPEPIDVDIAIFLDDSSVAALDPDKLASLDDLLDRPTARERYGLDLYVEMRGDFHRAAYFRGVFGFCHDQSTPKGIPVLQLNS